MANGKPAPTPARPPEMLEGSSGAQLIAVRWTISMMQAPISSSSQLKIEEDGRPGGREMDPSRDQRPDDKRGDETQKLPGNIIADEQQPCAVRPAA